MNTVPAQTIEFVCSCNITRSVWGETWARALARRSGANPNQFTSSGTIADTYLALESDARILFIAQIVKDLVGNPANDFAYEQGKEYKAALTELVEKGGLESLDRDRLAIPGERERVRTILEESLTAVVEPHERHLRTLAMREIGLSPEGEKRQTCYRPQTTYLSMTQSHADSLRTLLPKSAQITTAAAYSGVELIEPKNGIFACANFGTYLSYVRTIERVAEQIVLRSAHGTPTR